jgi:hypothetical protein
VGNSDSISDVSDRLFLPHRTWAIRGESSAERAGPSPHSFYLMGGEGLLGSAATTGGVAGLAITAICSSNPLQAPRVQYRGRFGLRDLGFRLHNEGLYLAIQMGVRAVNLRSILRSPHTPFPARDRTPSSDPHVFEIEGSMPAAENGVFGGKLDLMPFRRECRPVGAIDGHECPSFRFVHCKFDSIATDRWGWLNQTGRSSLVSSRLRDFLSPWNRRLTSSAGLYSPPMFKLGVTATVCPFSFSQSGRKREL